MGPTPIQRQTLEFIAAQSPPPTYREIAAHLGLKTGEGARRYVLALEKLGLVYIHPRVNRGIEVTPDGRAEVAG